MNESAEPRVEAQAPPSATGPTAAVGGELTDDQLAELDRVIQHDRQPYLEHLNQSIAKKAEKPHGAQQEASDPQTQNSSFEGLLAGGTGYTPWRPPAESTKPQPPYGTNPDLWDKGDYVIHPVKELQMIALNGLPGDTPMYGRPGPASVELGDDVLDVDPVYAHISLYLSSFEYTGLGSRHLSGVLGGELRPHIDGKCTIYPVVEFPTLSFACNTIGPFAPSASAHGYCELIVTDYIGVVIKRAQMDLFNQGPDDGDNSYQASTKLSGLLSVDVQLKAEQIIRVLFVCCIEKYQNRASFGNSLAECQLDASLKSWRVNIQ